MVLRFATMELTGHFTLYIVPLSQVSIGSFRFHIPLARLEYPYAKNAFDDYLPFRV